MAFSLSRGRSPEQKAEGDEHPSSRRSSTSGSIRRSSSPIAKRLSALVHPLKPSPQPTAVLAGQATKSAAAQAQFRDGLRPSGSPSLRALRPAGDDPCATATAVAATSASRQPGTDTSQSDAGVIDGPGKSSPSSSRREAKKGSQAARAARKGVAGAAPKASTARPLRAGPKTALANHETSLSSSGSSRNGQSNATSGSVCGRTLRAKNASPVRSESSLSSDSATSQTGYETAQETSLSRKSEKAGRASLGGGKQPMGAHLRSSPRQGISQHKGGRGTAIDEDSDSHSSKGDSDSSVSSRAPLALPRLATLSVSDRRLNAAQKSSRAEPRLDLEAELQALRAQLVESAEASSAQQEETHALRAELEAAKGQVQALEGEAEEAARENAKLQLHCQALESEGDRLTSALAAVQSESSSLQTSLEGFERESRNLKKTLMASAAEQDGTKQSLGRAYQEQERLGKALTLTSRQLDSTKDRLRVALDELEILRLRLTEASLEQTRSTEPKAVLQCQECCRVTPGGSDGPPVNGSARDENIGDSRNGQEISTDDGVHATAQQMDSMAETASSDESMKSREGPTGLAQENQRLRAEVEEAGERIAHLERSMARMADQGRSTAELRRELEECVMDIECMREEFRAEREGWMAAIHDAEEEREEARREIGRLEAKVVVLEETLAGSHKTESAFTPADEATNGEEMWARDGLQGETTERRQEETTREPEEVSASGMQAEVEELVRQLQREAARSSALEDQLEEVAFSHMAEVAQQKQLIGHLRASLSQFGVYVQQQEWETG